MKPRLLSLLIFLLSYIFYIPQGFGATEISSDFFTIFQNPSDIIQRDDLDNNILDSSSGSVYTCDADKDECRLNINVLRLDLGKLSSRLECQIDFGFITSQNDSCNPKTVIIPQGTHRLQIKVFEKKNPTNFSIQSYLLVNDQLPTQIEGIEKGPEYVNPKDIRIVYSGEAKPKRFMSDEVIIVPSDDNKIGRMIDQESNSNSGSDVSKIQIEKGDIAFEYILQRPSHITGSGGVYICDGDREECRINFKLIDLDTKKDLSSKFGCSFDFGFVSDQSSKCNPNTVIFPQGEYSVVMKVFQKDLPVHFIQQEIKIVHLPKQMKMTPQEFLSNKGKIIYLRGSIDIQSKPSKSRSIEGRKVICERVGKCNLNLSSSIETNNKLSGVSYHWNFGNGETASVANPSGIWYSPGEYEVDLEITDRFGNRLRDSIFIGVYRGYAGKQKISITQYDEDKKQDIYLTGNIIVQSKKSKNRTVSSKGVECSGVERCSINFDSSIDTNGVKSHVEYAWSFGNGEYSAKPNPSGIWYLPGEYSVVLNVSDGFGNRVRDTFHISVLGPTQDSIVVKELNAIGLQGEILNYSSSTGSIVLEDKIEKKVRKPNFSQSIIKQKRSLKIYGSTLPSTVIEVLLGDISYKITSDIKGKYALKITQLQAGKFIVRSKLLLSTGKTYEIPRMKDLVLDIDYVNSVHRTNAIITQNKIKKTKKKSAKKKTVKKELSVIPKAQADYNSDIYPSSIDFRTLNILLGLVMLLMGGLILRRWRII